MPKFSNFKKNLGKMSGVSTKAPAPSKWVGVQNYTINKVISGCFNKGIAVGRLTQVAGPSGAGKSFMIGNIASSAQSQGYGILAVDSENALDDTFMGNLGIDVDDEDYIYAGLNSISRCTKVVQNFIADYRAEKAKDENLKPFVICIDSLDMLMTDTEEANYKKGIIKGDQGQLVKQLKKMLTVFVHDIKGLDIAIVCAKQVYQEQDMYKAFNEPWKITESLRFAFSQILLVTKLMLKDDSTKKFEGIRLKVQGFKTRFTKPFQQCTVEVPYDAGMDPYNGLIEAAVAMDVVSQKGAWYTFNGTKFQRKTFSKVKEDVLQALIGLEDKVLHVDIDDEEDLSDVISAKKKTKLRAKGLAETAE